MQPRPSFEDRLARLRFKKRNPLIQLLNGGSAPNLSLSESCSRCVLDTSDPEIVFDAQGVCNHCRAFDERAADLREEFAKSGNLIEAQADRIRRRGHGKPYDCVIGVSGGTDSTYMVYYAKKELGLRPLAVHFDNGWNSELAVKNIEQALRVASVDLHTWVVDWHEFKNLQLAFFRAGVLDLEIPTDHGIIAALFTVAAKHGINSVVTGHNMSTEAVLPSSWYYNKSDATNIVDINRRFGKAGLKSFPLITIRNKIYWYNILGMSIEAPLNYLTYVKSDIQETLKRELGWRDYGGKHYESIFTRFYQGYILPRRFGIDKRKAHLSNLICAGQISRSQALEELAAPPMDPKQAEEDREYVIKKFDLTPAEFEALMTLPPPDHTEFRTEDFANRIYQGLLRRGSPIKRALMRALGRGDR